MALKTAKSLAFGRWKYFLVAAMFASAAFLSYTAPQAQAAPQTYDFNNTNLNDLLEFTFNGASGGPIVSPFDHTSEDGLSGTGAVNTTNATDTWTLQSGIANAGTGQGRSVGAYFYNYENSGYGGLGFSLNDQSSASSQATAEANIGVNFHGGGGNFILNGDPVGGLSWQNGDMQSTWMYIEFILIAEPDPDTFTVRVNIWQSDSSGTLGTLHTTHTQTGYTYAGYSEAATIYPYFAAGDSRFNAVDNFAYDLEPSLEVPAQESPFENGDGTEEDPYQINDCEQLQAINSDNSFLSANYIQTDDIDCSMTNPANDDWNDTGTWADEEGFDPLGCWYECDAFKGNYDGDNYEINDLYIDRSQSGVGLFRVVDEEGVISNVKLANPDITNASYVTGALGGLVYGTINDSAVIGGTVKAGGGWNYAVGGLVGAHEGLDTINNSTSSADVSGHVCVGGLVGENYGNIYGSAASGEVTGNYAVGGLVGCSNTWMHEEDLYINDSHATGDVYGNEEVGGLVGYINGDFDAKHFLNNVYASGNVHGVTDGDDSVYDIGGLVGDAEYTDIIESHATGNLVIGLAETSPYDDFSIYSVGGLTGGFDDGYIEDSYATGNINLLPGYEDADSIGGLIGRMYGSLIEDVYAEGNVTAGEVGIGQGGGEEVGGLVGAAYGSTILYSHATGEVRGTNETGGLVGYTDNGWVEIDTEEWEKRPTAIINSYATGNVSGSYELGGLVGDNNGGIIQQSYATGDVTGQAHTFYDAWWDDDEWIIEDQWEEWPENIGGLVGQNDRILSENYDEELEAWIDIYEPGLIEQSYATGNVTGNYDTGGLVGDNNESDIRDSYARGNVTGTGAEQSDIGGAIGSNDEGSIENVYATGLVTSNGSDIGGLAGDSDGSIENSFWDRQTTGKNTSGGGTGKSTSEMKNVATFTNLSTAGLDEPWDFVNNPFNDEDDADIWSIGEFNNGYPCLTWQAEAELCVNLETNAPDDNDGISSEVENAGPNGGDANNDGVLDSEQSNVASFVNTVNNKYVVIALDEQCELSAVSTTTEASNAVKDAGFDYLSGLVNFTADCGENGFTSEVKIYQYGVGEDGLVLRKHNPNSQAYFNVPNAIVSQTTIGGQIVTIATYSITDGGLLDIDDTENGIIVDPVGLATSAIGVPNTGLGGLSYRNY